MPAAAVAATTMEEARLGYVRLRFSFAPFNNLKSLLVASTERAASTIPKRSFLFCFILIFAYPFCPPARLLVCLLVLLPLMMILLLPLYIMYIHSARVSNSSVRLYVEVEHHHAAAWLGFAWLGFT